MDVVLIMLLANTAISIIIVIFLLIFLGRKKTPPYHSIDRDIEKIKEQIM